MRVKRQFLLAMIVLLLVLLLIPQFIVSSAGQSDRAISFITDALHLDMTTYQTSESHWGVLTVGDGCFNVWSHSC